TGYYFQAKKLSEIPVGIIKSTTLGVVFSALSNLQDDKEKFDYMYNNIIRVFTIIVGAICINIFLFSKEILFVLYGEKWLGADFYLKILALSSFFYMQEMFNRTLFKVFNQTKKIFILDIIKKCINLFSIILGVYYKSLELLMYGYLVTCILSYFINYYVSRTVYKSKAILKEMIYTLKVIFTIVVISGSYYLLQKIIDLKVLLYNLIFIIPVVVLYLFILHLLGVFNVKKDLSLLKSLKK